MRLRWWSSAGAVVLATTMVPTFVVTPHAGAERAHAQSGIVFTSYRDANADIWRMNADGSAPTNLTDNNGGCGIDLGCSAGKDYEPATSPSSHTILFTSERDGNAEVYGMGVDGSAQTNLTNSSASETQAAFSPDGSSIVFTSDRDGNNEIYRMNTDGSGQANLTNSSASETQAAFSPDGSSIVFTSDRDGNNEIYRMNTDGSGQANLTNNPGDDEDPAFSPDGRSIVFTRHADIWRMRVDGSERDRLTKNTALDYLATYSPDGSSIVFTSWRDADNTGSVHPEVFRMKADGSRPTNLTHNSGSCGSCEADMFPSWSGRSPSTTTVRLTRAPHKARVHGVLEPATVGNEVTIILARRQQAQWVTLTTKTVAVRKFDDRDGDQRTDASYVAQFGGLDAGRDYRITAKFRGDYFTVGSTARLSSLS